MLNNLVKNAMDAILLRQPVPQNPSIVFYLSKTAPHHHVVLSIVDNGSGLSDYAEKLLEPYITHKPKGTGLGLAIVKKIMEDHGGTIKLYDRSDLSSLDHSVLDALCVMNYDPKDNVGTIVNLVFPAL
jgi:two-component system nitrogen regulation sensor histidine kinase NtrY